MERISEVIPKRHMDGLAVLMSLTVIVYQSTDVIRDDPLHEWLHSVVKGLVELIMHERSVHFLTVQFNLGMRKLFHKFLQFFAIVSG